jgi:hypothetical protein
VCRATETTSNDSAPLLICRVFFSSQQRLQHVPQAQAAQQRLKHATAPPSYGQVSSSSKVHRRDGYLASVQIKLVIFNLFSYSSAECSSPVAAGSGLGTGLGTAIKNVRTVDNGASTPEAFYAPGAGGATTAKTCIFRLKLVSAPPSTTIKYVRPTASSAAGNGLGTTIKYLRRTRKGAAGIGLGTTNKYCAQCLSVGPELISSVHKQNPLQHTSPFASAAQNIIRI